MPKNKTHSGTAKRVKITGSGKLRRQQTRLRHRLEVKSSTVTRRQSGTFPLTWSVIALGACTSCSSSKSSGRLAWWRSSSASNG